MSSLELDTGYSVGGAASHLFVERPSSEDQERMESIRKVQGLSQNISHSIAAETSSRKIEEAVHLNRKISEEEISTMAQDFNFITKIRNLVNLIISQLSRINENDRKQMENLKREYRLSSHESAELEKVIGNAAPVIAGIGFAFSLSQFMWKNPDDRQLVKFIAEQLPNSLGGVYTGRKRAQQMEFQSLSSLRNVEIQNKGQKTGSESNSKQEVLALLNSTLDVVKRASSAN